MKIHIKEAGGTGFTIPVPLSLALRYINKGNLSDEEEKTSEQSAEEKERLKELAKALKQAKKEWGDLTIVEVKSADGDEVAITL